MMLRAAAGLALALLSGGAALAQEAAPDPGWSYRVVGIDTGEKLPVREYPTADAAAVGELAEGAKGVVVTGAVEDDGERRWVEILLAGGTKGFVLAGFLEEDRESGERSTGFPLACVGTEPFWSLTTDGNQVKMSTPAGDETFSAGGWLGPAMNSIDQTLRIGEGGYLAAVRGSGDCSPGMGTTVYPYWGLVVLPDGSTFGGCCSRGG